MVRLSRAAGERGGWLLAGGQGTARRLLHIEGAALASWIIGLEGPARRTDIEQALGEIAGDVQSGRDLLALLLDCGVLVDVDSATRLAAKGGRWEAAGWRDAFDFHYSGAGVRFYWTHDADEVRADIDRFTRDSEELGLPPQPGPYREGRPARGAIELAPHVAIPPPSDRVTMPEVLLHRRGADRFRGGAVDLGRLAHLLEHAAGVQRVARTQWGDALLKTYPSGGARHPLEVYVVARDVAGLARAIYHYDLRADALRMVGPEPADALVEHLTLRQPGVAGAGALLLVTCRWLRNTWKYRYSRNYRMLLLELGHLAETIRLVAVALGIDAYCTSGVPERAAADLLGLPDDLVEGAMLVVGIGGGRERRAHT